MTARPTPFDLVFGELAAARFPTLERAIRQAGHDPHNRDAFTLVKESVELLHELRPEEGFGEGVDEFVAFVHGGFAFWLDGRAVVQIGREALDRILRVVPEEGEAPALQSRSYYLQLAPQRVWGVPLEGAPSEPLDGAFVMPAGELSMVGVFGLHSGRTGFTVAQANGARPSRLARLDRTPLFAPRFESTVATGLFSLAGTEELLELGYRCHALLGSAGAEPGVQQLAVG